MTFTSFVVFGIGSLFVLLLRAAVLSLCLVSAALSQDEEVIIVCGDAKLRSVSVPSHSCLTVLGGSVKEVIKVLAALLLDELSVHASARVVRSADAQLHWFISRSFEMQLHAHEAGALCHDTTEIWFVRSSICPCFHCSF